MKVYYYRGFWAERSSIDGRPEVACAGLLLRRQRTPHGSAGRGAGRGSLISSGAAMGAA